jgi:hypothetical protein
LAALPLKAVWAVVAGVVAVTLIVVVASAMSQKSRAYQDGWNAHELTTVALLNSWGSSRAYCEYIAWTKSQYSDAEKAQYAQGCIDVIHAKVGDF